MILRPYQSDSLDKIRELYRDGVKRVMLVMPTGAGKTLVFCKLLKAAYDKGSKAIMVVRGVQLIEQASIRLDREGVPHGVMQANHWRRLPHEPIQICSIDTLYRRKITPEAQLVVIDEAHYAASPGFKWLAESYDGAYFLPVTATPFVRSGLRHIADTYVEPITIKELIEQGYLVPPVYYAPTHINLDGVRIDSKTGDYSAKDLDDRMRRPAIFGDIVKAYKQHASDRPAVAFAVNIEHSLEIAETFNRAGYKAVHVEADTPMKERLRLIAQLENREIDLISNVGILTTGVDIPKLSCIILARPTKSLNLYIQMLGRGTRATDGKYNFIVLDHANNIEEHGFIETQREVDLNGKQTRQSDEIVVICEACFSAFNPRAVVPSDYNCPKCGADNSPKVSSTGGNERNTTTDESYELKEIKPEEKERLKVLSFANKKVEIALRRGYKPGWVFYQIKNKFGDGYANTFMEALKRSGQMEILARQASQRDHFSDGSDEPV